MVRPEDTVLEKSSGVYLLGVMLAMGDLFR